MHNVTLYRFFARVSVKHCFDHCCSLTDYGSKIPIWRPSIIRNRK